MLRLRGLSEAECYTRLYGRDGEPAVVVLEAEEPGPERPETSSEELRGLFEERLDEEEAA